jgi:hypothetical protein
VFPNDVREINFDYKHLKLSFIAHCLVWARMEKKDEKKKTKRKICHPGRQVFCRQGASYNVLIATKGINVGVNFLTFLATAAFLIIVAL